MKYSHTYRPSQCCKTVLNERAGAARLKNPLNEETKRIFFIIFAIWEGSTTSSAIRISRSGKMSARNTEGCANTDAESISHIQAKY